MYVINTIDEQKRVKDIKFYNQKRIGQNDSHGYSYLYIRNIYKEMGEVMGLDKLPEQKDYGLEYLL